MRKRQLHLGADPPAKRQKTQNKSIVSDANYFEDPIRVYPSILHSEILKRCEKFHLCNLDKLRRDTLCISCNGYTRECQFYADVIENNEKLKCLDLQPIKDELISFLVYPKPEYYSKIGDHNKEYQLMLSDWNKYALKHSKLKRSINILKKQIATLNMDQFMELLVKLQPWMTSNDMMEIVKFEAEHNVPCTGCKRHRIGNIDCYGVSHPLWVCHIAVKLLLIAYFVVDLYLVHVRHGLRGVALDRIHSSMKAHMAGSCDWIWDITMDYRPIHIFGKHQIKGHIAETLAEKTQESNDETLFAQYCAAPPIVSIEALKSVEKQYLKELIRGQVVSNHRTIRFIDEVGGVTVRSE